VNMPGATGFSRLNDRKVLLAQAMMTALGLALALWRAAGSNLLRSDSPSYPYLDPSRTIGYPAFLSFVRLVTGHVAWAVPVQMTLLAAALLTLGWSFHRFSRRPLLSLAFQALLIGSPVMWKISALIMTEALATACVALWCAQLLRMLKAPSRSGTVLLVAASVVGTIIRPSLAALFVATALFELAVGSRTGRGRTLVVIGAGMLAAWVATPLGLYLVNGAATTSSPLARGVLQHTLFCSPGGMVRDADAKFVELNASPVRQYVETAPPNILPDLKRIYSGELRFGLIIPALGEMHKLESGWQTDPIIARVAKERVEANPMCYAKSVIAADFRMATYGVARSPGVANRIRDFIAAHPPVRVPAAPLLPRDRRDSLKAANEFHEPPPFPLPPAMPFKVTDKSPLLLILITRLLFSGAALLGLLSVFALAIRPKIALRDWNSVAGMAALGAAFHGMIAITAIVELGLTRYTVPVWPVVCTLLGIAVLGPFGTHSWQRDPALP